MRIAGVVADANVLLSAAIGKAALRVLLEGEVEVHVTRYNCDEVEDYLPVLAARYRLSPEIVEMQWRLLPIHVHEEAAYEAHLHAARERLARRDPDDAHPLALAAALGLPLWSNDNDLAGHGVARHTTAELLAMLDARRP
jgi:predicted nucleic acid-binding protein